MATSNSGVSFGLSGPDLMLAASLHSTRERCERQFLIEHLDRGYPCRWLVAVLNYRAIKFCMRIDKSDAGFACVREFALSGESERIVKLRAPDKQDAIDYECPRKSLLPILLHGGKIGRKVGKLLRDLLDPIAGQAYRYRENISKPRKPGRKPHKSMT